MTKKSIDQIVEAGIRVTTSGYTRKARPGPEDLQRERRLYMGDFRPHTSRNNIALPAHLSFRTKQVAAMKIFVYSTV